jgi:hypothetical protein
MAAKRPFHPSRGAMREPLVLRGADRGLGGSPLPTRQVRGIIMKGSAVGL